MKSLKFVISLLTVITTVEMYSMMGRTTGSYTPIIRKGITTNGATLKYYPNANQAVVVSRGGKTTRTYYNVSIFIPNEGTAYYHNAPAERSFNGEEKTLIGSYKNPNVSTGGLLGGLGDTVYLYAPEVNVE